MNNISFVIPAYNAEKTLKESVDSILDRNIENGDEIIIINDYSTDNTLIIAEDLAKRYDVIKIIDNRENIGCPASRNVGIREAKNDLIFNLDSDNVLVPSSVPVLKKILISNDADIVSFGEYHFFKEKTDEITHKWICRGGRFTLSDLFAGMINPAPGGNFLYRKSIWKKIRGYWEYGKGLHEAWGFSFKLLINNAVFFVAPRTHYFHRYSHDSLFVRENKIADESIRITNKFIEGSLSIFDESSIDCIKNNPDWFNNLEKHPLTLKNNNTGENGTLVFTSKIKQIIYLLKNTLMI